jgi:hypothetical protein
MREARAAMDRSAKPGRRVRFPFAHPDMLQWLERRGTDLLNRHMLVRIRSGAPLISPFHGRVAQRMSADFLHRRMHVRIVSRSPTIRVRPSSSGPGCSPFKRGDAGSNPAGRTNSSFVQRYWISLGRRFLLPVRPFTTSGCRCCHATAFCNCSEDDSPT